MTKHRHGQGKAAHQQQAAFGGHEQLENVQKLNKQEMGSSMKRQSGSAAPDTEKLPPFQEGEPQRFPGGAPTERQKLGSEGARKKVR